MPLGAALVDEARVIDRVAVAKVDGRKLRAPEQSAWFRARLTMPNETESGDEARRRYQKSPTLIVGRRDKTGEPIDISGASEIEVKSKQLGTFTFQVKGAPKPIRKRRSIIGYKCELARVEA